MVMKSKKAWIKIVEAFIAVILVMSALLIIASKNEVSIDRGGEIIKLEKAILDSIVQEDNMRNDILKGNISIISKEIDKNVPFWINYSVNICSYDSICPNPAGYINNEVYAQEALVFSNLTYSNPSNATKLKIFFWENEL
jgi:hypothetical protein